MYYDPPTISWQAPQSLYKAEEKTLAYLRLLAEGECLPLLHDALRKWGLPEEIVQKVSITFRPLDSKPFLSWCNLNSGKISIGRKVWPSEGLILHELAHWLAEPWRERAGEDFHGPTWQRTFVALVLQNSGRAEAIDLDEALANLVAKE